MHVHEKEFTAYLENTLTAQKREKMAHHFSQCSACSRKLKEWEMLYAAMDELEYDYSLDGLEEKILLKIKKDEALNLQKQEKPLKLIFNMTYVLLLLFITGLVISPIINMAGLSFHYFGNFLFNQGLDMMNEAKWHVVNFFSMLETININDWLFPLTAGVILICGGTYLSLSKRTAAKM